MRSFYGDLDATEVTIYSRYSDSIPNDFSVPQLRDIFSHTARSLFGCNRNLHLALFDRRLSAGLIADLFLLNYRLLI